MSHVNIPDHLWRDSDHVREAHRIIEIAVKLYRPRAVFALYSGGHDSVVSTHIASQHTAFVAAASVDTTIGIPEVISYRSAVCKSRGWRQIELRPKFTYRDICAKFGMPGPGRHDYAYRYLKERCFEELVRTHKCEWDDRIMLISGARKDESDRRTGTADVFSRDGAQLWVSPCVNWTAENREVYRVEHRLPTNPVKARLGVSGECLCGAFAKPGEMEKIEQYYPETAAEIRECERIAASNERPAKWGKRPECKVRACTQCTRKGSAEEVEIPSPA